MTLPVDDCLTVVSRANCSFYITWEFDFDLTGYRATWNIHEGTPENPGATILEISDQGATPYITVAGTPDNTLTVRVPPDIMDRENLPPKDYWAELILYPDNGIDTDYVVNMYWRHVDTGVGL